jgi:hypothetical protein
MDLISASGSLLSEEAGFAVGEFESNGRRFLGFEDITTLGFVFAYGTAHELLSSWERDLDGAIRDFKFGLRAAGKKAWNVYAVLLSEGVAIDFESVALTGIEENLSGTRKIARAGVSTGTSLKEALLPLIPIQAAPSLPAVDTAAEIEIRTTELSARIRQGFLSQTVNELQLLNIIEESI